MKEIIVSVVLMMVPILMYLVFSCYSAILDKSIEKIIFIITLCTSIYICFKYSVTSQNLLMLCNIPILIAYFKREELLGIIITIMVILFSYYHYDINIIVLVVKYLCYFLLYLWLCKKKNFNYLFFKNSAIIQAFFISFEYFMLDNDGLIKLIIMVFSIYFLTFFSLYLFKLANNVTKLYSVINSVSEENKIKNSLFKLTHEIKNPLAVCKGYIDMIDFDDISRCKKYIGIIKSELDRSLSIMADFVDYSKIKINKEEMDIVFLLDDIYESFEILMKNKNISFIYDNCDDEIYLMGDYGRLKQVLVNVLKNSIEAISVGGIIRMNVIKNNDMAVITITDNGIGMDYNELKNIKEMFYTTKKNGTGLGVALSNEIVLAHGGILTYESKKGHGTKCVISIPI